MHARIAPLILVACAAGCDLSGSAASEPDANPEWAGPYRLTVSVVPMIDSPIVRIAGETTNSYETTLENEAAAEHATIFVENLVDGQPASSVEAKVDCDYSCGERGWSQVSTSYLAYASGELRYSSISCDAPDGFGCIGDAFPTATCSPSADSCADGLGCGLKRVSWSPSHGWLQCVPRGTVEVSAPCAIDENGIDDCAAGLYCIAGTCRNSCYPESDQCGTEIACEQVPGTTPGIGACAD